MTFATKESFDSGLAGARPPLRTNGAESGLERGLEVHTAATSPPIALSGGRAKRGRSRRALPLLALLAAAGCAERDPAFDRPRVVTGPVPLKDAIAYVDGALDRVVIVDVGGEVPEVTGTPVGRRPIWAVPTPAKDRLLVITRGEE